MTDLVDSMLRSINWNQPLFQAGPDYVTVLLVALGAGVGLAVLCQLGTGGFRVWGFNVGFIGTHFLWVASCIVATKYGALMCGAVVYLFMLLKYIDEAAPVFQSELMSAAQARSPELYDHFKTDPEGLRSVTDTLNAGIGDPAQDREEVTRKLMERLKREFILGLVGGALFFGLLAIWI